MENVLAAALGQTKKVLIGIGEEWAYDNKNISNDIAYKKLLDQAKDGFEWLVQSTKFHPVGEHVGINVDPFNIQIMNKPESEDEEAAAIDPEAATLDE